MDQNDIKGELMSPFECSRNYFFRGSDEDTTSFPVMPTQTMETVIDSFANALRQVKPDLVVCDFYSVFGHYAADRVGLPVVLSLPGLVEMASTLW